MALQSPQDVLGHLKSGLPPQWSGLLDQRDGAYRVVKVLRQSIDPTETTEGQLWDDCARFYTVQGRFHEALVIYHRAMYSKLVDMQGSLGERKHKGTPLVRISEIPALMEHPLLARALHRC